MNKVKMIETFLEDVNYDGTNFNNPIRVKNEIAIELAKTDDRIKTYEKFSSTYTSYIPDDVNALMNEALEAAHMELTSRPGYQEALAKRQESMCATTKSMAAYYEKYGTQGEF